MLKKGFSEKSGQSVMFLAKTQTYTFSKILKNSRLKLDMMRNIFHLEHFF